MRDRKPLYSEKYDSVPLRMLSSLCGVGFDSSMPCVAAQGGFDIRSCGNCSQHCDSAGACLCCRPALMCRELGDPSSNSVTG